MEENKDYKVVEYRGNRYILKQDTVEDEQGNIIRITDKRATNYEKNIGAFCYDLFKYIHMEIDKFNLKVSDEEVNSNVWYSTDD